MQQKAKKVESGVNRAGAAKPVHVWANVKQGLCKGAVTQRYYERIRAGGRNKWLSLETPN